MIKIWVFTDDFRKWIEKFEKSLKIDLRRGRSRIGRNEIFLTDEEGFVEVKICRGYNENMRGSIGDVVILDKSPGWDMNVMRYSLMGHRGSIIRTENYWEEEQRKYEIENTKNELKN